MIDAKKFRELYEANEAAHRDQFKHDEEGYDDGIVHALHTDQELRDFLEANAAALLSSCERAERLAEAARKAADHLACIGHPIDAGGNYDKNGTWTFSEAVPERVNSVEVGAAFHALRLALSEHEASGKGGSDEGR